MNVTTLAARGAAALVAAVAGAASYEHIYSVAYAAGERSWVAAALPLAIDGLIVVGVSALLEDRRNRVKARLSARVAVLVGVVATIAANVASAEPHLRARLVAVAAPVAFLLAVEVLTRRGRATGQIPRQPDGNVTAEVSHSGTSTEPKPDRPTRARPATPAAAKVTRIAAKDAGRDPGRGGGEGGRFGVHRPPLHGRVSNWRHAAKRTSSAASNHTGGCGNTHLLSTQGDAREPDR